jgi:hypothetical protein
VSVSEENIIQRPKSLGEESSGGENMAAITSSTTSTSGPDASTAPWPSEKAEKAKKVSKSSSVSDERLEDTGSSGAKDIGKEAKLEETLKDLDKKLAEIDGSLKKVRPSSRPTEKKQQLAEQQQESNKEFDGSYEEDNELEINQEDPHMSEDPPDLSPIHYLLRNYHQTPYWILVAALLAVVSFPWVLKRDELFSSYHQFQQAFYPNLSMFPPI